MPQESRMKFSQPFASTIFSSKLVTLSNGGGTINEKRGGIVVAL
jgi:hypothetical protein